MRETAAQFKSGLLTQNPTFVLLLGMCPVLATSTSLRNGLGMGLATTAVLIFSNLFISALRKVIPDKIRIAAYIVIISTFATAVEYVLQAYVPALHQSLGLFIPLIVVNCIVLARAEMFASKNNMIRSAIDGLTVGLGFTLALGIVSTIREVVGNGTLLGLPILPEAIPKVLMIALPPGGFLTLGCVIALSQKLQGRKRKEGKA